MMHVFACDAMKDGGSLWDNKAFFVKRVEILRSCSNNVDVSYIYTDVLCCKVT